ncbi:haloacid dehalogenase type II [Psychromonas sp. 14N.309.X.WAT.B.A12]|uniref:haloacid dehalogenase type II n=1 Tax=unclassified Psychromonas TaxID=2614957 RepID=UPI0025B1EED5|nr:haloacid dehalogenase type II [Psychromonas sp. 14N.309.X.WAT.B.A12]MDN2661901.1 haloacid dehalogenase type II [Psychromonas sp. 14N.309.X.WAT.B.A12]
MIKLKSFIFSLVISTIFTSPLVHASPTESHQKMIPKVIFFDVNETLLNLDNVGKSVSKALGGRDELVPFWFTTMLHYSLVSNETGEYHSFAEIGIASLEMIAKQQNIDLTPEQAKTAVLTPFRDLAPHADVVEGLTRIRALGYKMITLTNSSDAGIAAQLKNSNLAQYFDGSLTVQNLQTFKPDLKVYQWAEKEMEVAPEDAMLIAAHAWDIAGADKVGWKTAYILRPGKALYPLANKPDLTGKDLIEIAKQLEADAK